jgi:hypothetical protein
MATTITNCNNGLFIDDPCATFTDVQDAFSTYASAYNYTWISGGTDLRMINITGDDTNTASTNAGKGIVLLLSSYSQDCVDWLTQT